MDFADCVGFGRAAAWRGIVSSACRSAAASVQRYHCGNWLVVFRLCVVKRRLFRSWARARANRPTPRVRVRCYRGLSWPPKKSSLGYSSHAAPSRRIIRFCAVPSALSVKARNTVERCMNRARPHRRSTSPRQIVLKHSRHRDNPRHFAFRERAKSAVCPRSEKSAHCALGAPFKARRFVPLLFGEKIARSCGEVGIDGRSNRLHSS